MQSSYNLLSSVIFLQLLLLRVAPVTSDNDSDDECQKQISCGDCIQLVQCVYCLDANFSREVSRCLARADTSACVTVEDPANILVREEMLNVSLGQDSASGDFVQISPQYMKLRLRVGSTETIRFSVSQSQDYPVDLYYLMDLSNSMSDDRENIVRLGEDLATAIEKITQDYTIGFGSFVDKELLPYISLKPGENCQQKGGKCPPPYSFQHQMSLVRDARLFTQRVSAAPISGNIDNPEGGLDALMQVMVCGNKIGWRQESRRVVVYTTDQSFHMAGDGKLGGLVDPNDGQCHLNTSGFYDWSTVQDYPSLGHIAHVARENSVSIIWAVTSAHISLYSSLTEIVSGSVAGQISSDSSNVVELIEEQYRAITTRIELEDNSGDAVSIRYSSDCGRHKGGKRRRRCRNVPLGSLVEFTANITLKRCEAQKVVISPVGMEDTLVIDIEPICECGCSEEGSEGYDFTSEHCDYHGNLVCGECECFDRPDTGDRYYGDMCQCAGNLTSGTDPEAGCRVPGDLGWGVASVCSGRGQCQCGACVCDSGGEMGEIYGEWCQCDNLQCDRDKSGSLCGGHGACVCRECECEPGWSGPACDCREAPEQCLAPDTEMTCSGHGTCECGQCRCDDGWTGPLCDTCPTCTDTCDQLKACVECVVWASGDLLWTVDMTHHPDVCFDTCPLLFRFSFSDDVSALEMDTDWYNCTHKNESYCQYTFLYKEDPGLGLVDVVMDKSSVLCPVIVKPDYLGWALGIAGMIVAVGLLTLFLWKTFTTISDRREFARFEEERMKMKFNANSNPIFKQATTTIQNPMFCKEPY